MADRLLHAELARQFDDEFGALDGNVANAGAVLAENDAPLQFGGGVVEVDDGALHALQALEGAADQVFPCLGEDLDGDAVRNAAVLDQEADEVEIRLRS